MKKAVHITSVIFIVLLVGLVIFSRHEIRQANEESFKSGVYFGVKSLRVLIEQKEADISWDKLFVMAVMAQMDEKEGKPLYEPLKEPMGKVQGHGWETLPLSDNAF